MLTLEQNDLINRSVLIEATFKALHMLNGCGSNDEILQKVIEIQSIPDEVVKEPHLGSLRQTELSYRLAWARTYLKDYGAIINKKKRIWSITEKYAEIKQIDPEKVIDFMKHLSGGPAITDQMIKSKSPNAPANKQRTGIVKTDKQLINRMEPEKPTSLKKAMQKRNSLPYIDELRQLKYLYDDGVITQKEFEAKKKQLLSL